MRAIARTSDKAWSVDFLEQYGWILSNVERRYLQDCSLSGPVFRRVYMSPLFRTTAELVCFAWRYACESNKFGNALAEKGRS